MNNNSDQTNFQPIFDYIDDAKKDILAQVATKDDIKLLQNSMDVFAKQTKDYYQEVTVMVAKVSRMEAWIQKTANKIGIAYDV